ncbi:hypothetical protein GCM10028796_23230 [Ramlibacter monticola]|uniref:Tetratricopeptide repeat protein n=1 Tax=Ramlibacter monticola TaxID=1926872 RepID=A0A936YZX3_9BURK|nr:hypothetical protein [Ramlibacter monticola]MBL0392570.1 hypothetical protein [Ramlibacter monticola]
MRTQRFLVLLFTLLLVLAGLAARAQDTKDPTVDDIYKAASSGNLTGARSMVDQVIAKHPNSAKAHYVKAEIAARQRDAAVARTELQIADKLAPGLPFAKPEAVTALRAQVDQLSQPRPAPRPMAPPPIDPRRMAPPPPPPRAGGGFPMGGLLLLGLLVLGVVLFLRSRRRAAPPPPPAYAPQGLDAGFGRYDANVPPPGYGNSPQAGYGNAPQAAAPSLGSTLGRGLATGLAVGAGAVAAQEIGRRMFDHEGRPAASPPGEGGSAVGSPLARDAGLGALTGDSRGDPNADMGGQDFGIADNRGWDDAGGDDFGLDEGGDDWNT